MVRDVLGLGIPRNLCAPGRGLDAVPPCRTSNPAENVITNRGFVESFLEGLRVDQALLPQVPRIAPVLLTVRELLGDRDVVDLQTPAGRPVGVFVVDGNQTFLPSLRQCCGRRFHPVGVVPERSVELAVLSQCSVDLIGEVRPRGCVDVRLLRDEECRGARLGTGPGTPGSRSR